MRTFLLKVLVLAFVFPVIVHASGIQVGRTRVIYDASKKEVALPLKNSDKDLPWLIQSWIDTGDGKTRGPFIITPPLFRLDPQKEQNLRITWSGQSLPTDRESLFYMNVRTIPAMAKEEDGKNVLRLIYKTRLKLFWRPAGLKGTSEEACKTLRFSKRSGQLQITNSANFYSVFDNLIVGNTSLTDAELVAPKATTTFNLPAAASGMKVNWRCMTDYGNATKAFTSEMNDGA